MKGTLVPFRVFTVLILALMLAGPATVTVRAQSDSDPAVSQDQSGDTTDTGEETTEDQTVEQPAEGEQETEPPVEDETAEADSTEDTAESEPTEESGDAGTGDQPDDSTDVPVIEAPVDTGETVEEPATGEEPTTNDDPATPVTEEAPQQAVTTTESENGDVSAQGTIGGLSVNVETSNGNPLAGATFTVNANNGGVPGAVLNGPFTSDFVGFAFQIQLNPGTYFLVQTAAPTDFEPIDPLLVTVVAASSNDLDIVNEYIGNATTGTLDIDKFGDNGQRLADACFQVFAEGHSPDGQVIEDGCTDGSGDLSLTLLQGDYELFENSPPLGFTAFDDTIEFSVFAGETTLLQVSNNQIKGTLTALALSENGNPLANACFTVNESNNGQPGDVVNGPFCSDTSSQAFSIFSVPGSYFIVETQSPTDFDRIGPAAVAATVVANQTTTVTFEYEYSGPLTTGRLEIDKFDDEGNRLADACFQMFVEGDFPDGDPVDDGCTNSSGDLNFTLDPGAYVLFENDPPDNFEAFDPTNEVSIFAGETVRLSVANDRTDSGTFTATKVDGNGDPLEGACFVFYEDLKPGSGFILGDALTSELCSDASGFILSRNQAPGELVAFETVTPPGFITVDTEFTVTTNQQTNVQIVNEEASADTPGRLIISKADNSSSGNLLAGACWRLFENDGGDRGAPATPEICDEDDGTDDGITTLEVQEGSYLLGETVAPVFFELRDDEEIEVVRGGRQLFTLSDQPDPLAPVVSVQKIDENNVGLPGACFQFFEDLDPDHGQVQLGDQLEEIGERCSNANGSVLFRVFALGDYVAVETVTPDGFAPAPPTEFTAAIGQSPAVRIVNFRAGTLNVVKLFCEGDEDAVEFDVFDPANAAADVDDSDCERGDAEFQVAVFGETVTAPFNTGDDGEITLDGIPETLNEEPHELIETSTGESVAFEIAPGDVTTIVVRNIEVVDDGDDDGDDGDDDNEDDVTTLPNTGAGTTVPGTAETVLLALLSLAVLGGAYAWQRRRFI